MKGIVKAVAAGRTVETKEKAFGKTIIDAGMSVTCALLSVVFGAALFQNPSLFVFGAFAVFVFGFLLFGEAAEENYSYYKLKA